MNEGGENSPVATPQLTLYVARHAETANPKDILYGRLPRFDLSARGKEQAAATAAAMAELPLQAIYCSPLLRARRTAELVAAHHPGIPLRRSVLLLENLHPYQGRPQAEVAKLGERAYDPDILGDVGETIQDVCDRVARFLRMMQRRHPGGVIAVVAHADPLSALRLHLLGKELTQRELRVEAPPLASVFKVELFAEDAPWLEWFWKPTPPPTPAQQAPATAGSGAAGTEHEAVSAGTSAVAIANGVAR
jgi:broad specificity phosphatase PhoE